MDINTHNDKKTLHDALLIHFPEGILGFESLTDYKLFSSETEENLYWLKPEEDEMIEFAVTFPQVFQIDYEISIDDDDTRILNINDNDEIVVLVTLSKNVEPKENESLLNANFIAPIIINTNKRLGLQKILNKQKNPVTITMKG